MAETTARVPPSLSNRVFVLDEDISLTTGVNWRARWPGGVTLGQFAPVPSRIRPWPRQNDTLPRIERSRGVRKAKRLVGATDSPAINDCIGVKHHPRVHSHHSYGNVFARRLEMAGEEYLFIRCLGARAFSVIMHPSDPERVCRSRRRSLEHRKRGVLVTWVEATRKERTKGDRGRCAEFVPADWFVGFD